MCAAPAVRAKNLRILAIKTPKTRGTVDGILKSWRHFLKLAAFFKDDGNFVSINYSNFFEHEPECRT